MDAIASELGIDRIEIRRRNLIPASAMPYRLAFDEPHVENLEFDSGDYELLLDKALERFGWDQLQDELQELMADG